MDKRKKWGMACVICAAAIIVIFSALALFFPKEEKGAGIEKQVKIESEKPERKTERRSNFPTDQPEVESEIIGDEQAAMQSAEAEEAVRLMTVAGSMIGTRYNPLGFCPEMGFSDLSFVYYCWSQAGLANYKISSYDILYSRCLSHPEEGYLPGDLVFFEERGELFHVGILLDGGRMIHCTEQVEIISLTEAEYWNSRIAAYGRICRYRDVASLDKEDTERYEEET